MRTLKGNTIWDLRWYFFITRVLCLQNFKTLFSLYGLPFVSVMTCVVAENIHNPPTEVNGNSEGRRDVEKEAITEGVGGCLQRSFSRGLSKIGELLLNNSFSVEKAYISYFTVTGVSKQALLFALIVFFLGPAKCFFQLFSLTKYSRISLVRTPKGTERSVRIREVSVLERSIWWSHFQDPTDGQWC